jgi:hypothetical protein
LWKFNIHYRAYEIQLFLPSLSQLNPTPLYFSKTHLNILFKNFLFSMFRLALGSTQPPIQCVPGAFPPGIKRPVREADHSPPCSAEVKMTWIYTSTPPYVFMLSTRTILPPVHVSQRVISVNFSEKRNYSISQLCHACYRPVRLIILCLLT